jgi:NAD(P)-dependent dehydrogenase (short-subunit alcohol dehydrogenase family)
VAERLEGKVAVITGAAGGIGREAALLFSSEGASVCVADVGREAGEKTASECREAFFFQADVSDPSSVQAMYTETERRYGRIDVLYNNAGIMPEADHSVIDTSVDDWDRVMAVNVRGVFLVSKFAVPYMIEKKRGSIINMSSTIAEIGLAQRASYAASKGAILALTRAMQVDYAPFGIRVNALLPGTIHTPFVEKYLRESYPNREEGLKAIRKRQLTDELGKPEDVANAALFLASDESSFVMGSGLFVDGGVRGGK